MRKTTGDFSIKKGDKAYIILQSGDIIDVTASMNVNAQLFPKKI